MALEGKVMLLWLEEISSASPLKVVVDILFILSLR